MAGFPRPASTVPQPWQHVCVSPESPSVRGRARESVPSWLSGTTAFIAAGIVCSPGSRTAECLVAGDFLRPESAPRRSPGMCHRSSPRLCRRHAAWLRIRAMSATATSRAPPPQHHRWPCQAGGHRRAAAGPQHALGTAVHRAPARVGAVSVGAPPHVCPACASVRT